MTKKALYSVFLLLCCIYLPCAQAEEKITLSTFYPAPYGEYEYLAANSMVVGRTYPFPAEDNLIVEGSVGIGKTSPSVALQIADSIGGVNMALQSYTHLGTRYSSWDTWLGQNIRVIDDVNTSGVELATSYIASGASALNLGFNSLNFYQWPSASLSGLSTGSDLTLPIPSLTVNPSGNVGIGTTSPDNKLHIFKGSAGSITGYDEAPLVVENSTTNYIQFLSPNTANQGLMFGDPESVNRGMIQYRHSEDDMRFYANGGWRMTINSSGNVGIGTTSPSTALHINRVTRAAWGGWNEAIRLQNNSHAAITYHDADNNDGWLQGFHGNNKLYWAFITDWSGGAGDYEMYLTSVGNLVIDGTLTQGSSREIKKDISYLAENDYRKILDKVRNTEVATYREKGENVSTKLRIGVIAEEAPEEIVSEDRKSIMTSDYLGFLMAAIKAQQQEIQILKQEVSRLKENL